MQCNGNITCRIIYIVFIIILLSMLVVVIISGPTHGLQAPKPPVSRKNFNRKRK